MMMKHVGVVEDVDPVAGKPDRHAIVVSDSVTVQRLIEDGERSSQSSFHQGSAERVNRRMRRMAGSYR